MYSPSRLNPTFAVADVACSGPASQRWLLTPVHYPFAPFRVICTFMGLAVVWEPIQVLKRKARSGNRFSISGLAS